MRLELIRPTLNREAEFMAMVEEFLNADERQYVNEDVLFTDGFTAYIDWLAAGERGEVEGLVPWSAYWAVNAEDGSLVGMSSLRHKLSPWLAEFGGHIGYRIRPSMRGHGAGTTLLGLTLDQAFRHGLSKALVVCTPENLASQGVLRNNGAMFEREVATEGQRLMRYWVASDQVLAPLAQGRVNGPRVG